MIIKYLALKKLMKILSITCNMLMSEQQAFLQKQLNKKYMLILMSKTQCVLDRLKHCLLKKSLHSDQFLRQSIKPIKLICWSIMHMNLLNYFNSYYGAHKVIDEFDRAAAHVYCSYKRLKTPSKQYLSCLALAAQSVCRPDCQDS